MLKDKPRWDVPTLIVLALGMAWTLASRAPAATITGGAPPPSPRVGFTAPDFTLDLLEGGQVTLPGLRGLPGSFFVDRKGIIRSVAALKDSQ